MSENKPPESNPGYETTDAEIRPLVYTGVVILVLMFGSFIGIIPLFKILNYYQSYFDDEIPALVDQRVSNNEPRLQIDPPRQKFQLLAHEDQILDNYAWVDQTNAKVRIPIERAIELVGNGVLSIETRDHRLTLP